MKKIKSILSMLLGVSALAACNVLELEPLDSYNESNIFSNAELTQTYVNGRYADIRNGLGYDNMSFISDEAVCNHNWNSCYTINQGLLTPDDLSDFSVWKSYYSSIFECNTFFANLDAIRSTTASEEEINVMIGEMTFLRAYYYTELVNFYGGVCWITENYELNDEYDMPRSSYEECVANIVKELDAAAALLPLKQTNDNFGRATKGAALALKSKLLLYAASKQWNPSNDAAKWEAAQKAAKDVIDLGIYELEANYTDVFLNAQNSEAIFLRQFTAEHGHAYNGYNSPNGKNGPDGNAGSGYCALNPTQQMVDAYEMEDGTAVDPAVAYAPSTDPAAAFAGRDPRFYQTIIFNTSVFRGREIETWINGTYSDGKWTNDGTGAMDSQYSSVEGWNASETSYACRKYMDESLSNIWSEGCNPWVYSRLGEIYLNYAEASCALGQDAEAQKYVNLIRERARNGKTGILPDLTETGDDLMAKIQHERRIELAFEGHRYFDVRRWGIAEQTENEDVKELVLYKDAAGVYNYTFLTNQVRTFIAPNHYLMPIPNSDIRKAPSLVQNPGYAKI